MSEKRELAFVGIDYWNRPQFKDANGNYFGNVDVLFNHGATFEEVTKKITEDDICYFGTDPDCDPDGRKIKADKIILVEHLKREDV